MTVLVIGDGSGQTVGVTDTYIASGSPTVNSNTASSTYVGTPASGRNRQILRFSGMPSGPVLVSSAVISILNADAMGSTRSAEVRELLNPFVASEVTWNNRNASTNWNVAGVLGGTDVGASVVATGTMPTTSSTRFTLSGAGLNALVQGWMDGSVANNGIIWNCVDDTVTTDSQNRRVASAENGGFANRPYMTVTYESITPPSLTVSDPTVSHLSGTATFTITASSTFGTNLTVDYATADVTATAGVDYVAKSGTATIPAGQTTATVVVDILP